MVYIHQLLPSRSQNSVFTMKPVFIRTWVLRKVFRVLESCFKYYPPVEKENLQYLKENCGITPPTCLHSDCNKTSLLSFK